MKLKKKVKLNKKEVSHIALKNVCWTLNGKESKEDKKGKRLKKEEKRRKQKKIYENCCL